MRPEQTTLRGMPAPPGPGSHAPPKRSVSPSPESAGAVARVQVGPVDVKWKGSGFRRVFPWLVPVILSAAGTVGGWALGYFRGLAAAGERMAKTEAAIKLQGEKRAALETRVEAVEGDQNTLFKVQRDHDKRLPTAERDLVRLEGRVGAIEKTKPIIVQPSN